MRAQPTIIKFLLCWLAAGGGAVAAEPGTLYGPSGTLGSAYRSEGEVMVGGECVSGSEIEIPRGQSTFSLTQTLSERDASRLLDMAAGARGRFGAVKVSASAHFVKSATSTEQSVSAIWASDYRLPGKKLTNPVKTKVGEDASVNHERWVETCGDRFVSETAIGARLLFSIRVDFRSREQKESFEAKFSLKGSVHSAKLTLSQATREFSRDTKVVVTGLQQGGDVSKITRLFPATEEGRAGFVQCTLGDFEKCAVVIQDFLYYATDVERGFPSQLAPGATPGGAILEYYTAPYSAIGIYMNPAPGIDEANAQARSRLHSTFEDHLKLSVLADRLLETDLATAHRERVIAERKKVDQNLDAILAASEVCYDKPTQCRDAVARLDKLPGADRTAFNLPPTPQASFRVWTSGAGVWTRERSVRELNVCKRHPNPHPATREDEFWYQRTMHDLAPEGETVGTGLLIEGVALAAADLYFEERLIRSIPLRSDTQVPDKFGTGWAFLILATTRENPGWRDIDLDAERNQLIANGLTAADGVFYVQVRDSFGRRSRFDLEYQAWSGGANFSSRNRWWQANSNGVSVAGSNDWSVDVTKDVLLRRREGCTN